MTKLITINISGIKCDAEDCDYIDNSVNRDNYLEYIGKPCPECGSVLLTQADYEAVLALESLERELDIDIPADLLGKETDFSVSMDGSGEIRMVKKGEKVEKAVAEVLKAV